jgi:2-keto-4-pentenoate hydratase/2-oxohepta-3-ene-1,7-dioic acid hydratase in catechol pathway
MKVLCVGSNYAHHVTEMGQAKATEPTWFWKPESAIIHEGDAVLLPAVGEIHHEVELAVRIGARARRIDVQAAARCVDAYTVAVDVTARDLQKKAKAEGKPWTQAKGYDTFLPLGAWLPCAAADVADLPLHLALDGVERQRGRTSEMTWSVPELVARASQWTTLEPGDILLTGTPQGVGPLRPGQRMEARVGEAAVRNPIEAAR